MNFLRRRASAVTVESDASGLDTHQELEALKDAFRPYDDRASSHFTATNRCLELVMKLIDKYPRGGEGRTALAEAGDGILALMDGTRKRESIHRILKANKPDDLTPFDVQSAQAEAQGIDEWGSLVSFMRDTVGRVHELIPPEVIMPGPELLPVSEEDVSQEVREHSLMNMQEAIDFVITNAQIEGWSQLDLHGVPDFIGRELENLAAAGGVECISIQCVGEVRCIGLHCSAERGSSLINAVHRMLQSQNSGVVH